MIVLVKEITTLINFDIKIYVKKIEELYQKTSQPSSDTIQEPLYEPINIDSLYDADIPTITRSEFTP